MGLQQRVLGLDPGTQKLGYGIVQTDGATVRYLDCGVLTAPRGWDSDRRLGELGHDLEMLLLEWDLSGSKGDACAYEEGFVHPKQRSVAAVMLGAARGICIFLARRAGMMTIGYAPTTVK